MGQTFCKDY